MKSSSLAVAFTLSLLSGCTAAEHAVLALAPGQMQGGIAERVTEASPQKPKSATKRPKPAVAAVREAEPVLPPWIVPSPMPQRVLGATLTPSQLFKSVSPAVYTVAVLGQSTQQVTSQGSAVAVSPKEAITNCHVVAQAKGIVLANAVATLRAEVVSADRNTDRCYLRVLDGELEPVAGFRDYDSLAVGEVVFTIGSPKGLVNTLGHGLLSGLRRSEGGAQYIQITAPVSEGSSGGGLFDDRGNLIGVTTFTIRDSQNLNFAIAASQYWR